MNDNNNFNMNNPFLALDNNPVPNNEPVDIPQNNQVETNNSANNNLNNNIENDSSIIPNIPSGFMEESPNNSPCEENIDAVLGINQFNNNENNTPNNQELDSILGLNTNENNNMELPTPPTQNIEESKDQQLDAILGLNNQGENQNNNIDNNNNNNQEEIVISKSQKTLRNDFIVLFILELLLVGMTISEGNFNIFNAIFAVLALLEIYLTSTNSKFSWIVGIIFGIGMISTIIIKDIIDALLGIFVLIHSIICLIKSKKNNKKTT